MIVTCPAPCSAMNRVPDERKQGTTIRCAKCKRDLTVLVLSHQIADTTARVKAGPRKVKSLFEQYEDMMRDGF